MSTILNHYVEMFESRKDVAANDAEPLLDGLIESVDESLIADVLGKWSSKGISEDEIYYFAKILRGRMKTVESQHAVFVDIVGTGGSRAKTFNISTAAAFVVAGSGIAVAKHGNKAATSNSGSSDVLSELGVDHAAEPSEAERSLNELGICFMFAPVFHRLSPTLAKVRRGLGFPTIFNCVGPLCNPASAPHQLIGVWEKEMLLKMANALARLGTRRSWLVHAEDGLDEISLSGRTFVAEVTDEGVNEFSIEPADVGMQRSPIEHFRVSNAVDSAKLVAQILSGDNAGRDVEQIVLINAAAALYLTNGVGKLADGVARAKESINVGNAMKKLEQLRETQKR